MDQRQDQPEGHQHQGQAIARAAARLAGGPQFHTHLNTELGVGHLLGLLSGAHDFGLHLGPPGIASGPLVGQTGSGGPRIAGLGGADGLGLDQGDGCGFRPDARGEWRGRRCE